MGILLRNADRSLRERFTAGLARVSREVLQRISSRFTSEVCGVDRAVLDISGGPPSTFGDEEPTRRPGAGCSAGLRAIHAAASAPGSDQRR